MKNLKHFFLSNGKHPVDITKFPHLIECSIDWNHKIVGFDVENSINKLTIWKFKPKLKDFGDLKGCRHVKYMHITESNIESWSGIEKLIQLIHFEAYYVRNLKNLKGLEKLPHLKDLWLNNCPRLEDYESDLKYLNHLEQLRLNSCGELQSLKFIKSLPKLKSITFVDTNVIDGDMTPTLELDYAGYDNKRHYSHKMKEYN